MPKKQPTHRAAPSTVWNLHRMEETRDARGTARWFSSLGSFSTAANAQAEAGRIIAQEAGIRNLRMPNWAPQQDGFELIYGRDDQSWRFTVLPSIVDGASR